MGAGARVGRCPRCPIDTPSRSRSTALVKGHRRRLWYRRTGLICLILLGAVSAFWSGRLTSKVSAPEESMSFSLPRQNSDTVLVARDLITWLEAGRFFKQLGMEERAHKAFEEASTLTQSTERQHRMSTQETQPMPGEDGLASLLARCDMNIQQQPSMERSKPIPVVHRKQLSIIAQSLGGKNHDR